MTPHRVKQVMRMARTAPPAKVRDLYFEVFGAVAGATLTVVRCRESIVEACEELLNKPSPATVMRRRHLERWGSR